MTIEWGMMFCAVSNCAEHNGFPVDKGFLNRHTGEVVFIYPGFGEAEAVSGSDVAVDNVFDQAAVDANPDAWVEIPKYDQRLDNCDEEEFIRRFLKEKGIEAELV